MFFECDSSLRCVPLISAGWNSPLFMEVNSFHISYLIDMVAKAIEK